MSPAYEYRKVYADLVAPDGTIVVLYQHWLCLGGAWTGRASLERYLPDGERRLAHGVGTPRRVEADAPASALSTIVRFGDGSACEVEIEPVLGPWAPSTPPPVPALEWRVLAARTRTRVTWGEQRWEGIGYVDFVRITRPTRLTGLRLLRWGHVHLGRRTIVFEQVEGAGAGWHTGLDWTLGAEAVELTGPNEIDARGRGRVPLAQGCLLLDPERVLHDGDAFDALRVPSAIDRLACRVIGGPTWETRWHGWGTVGAERAPALYEVVRFG